MLRHHLVAAFFCVLRLFQYCGLRTRRTTLRDEHTQLEYVRRLDRFRDALRGVTLERLYEARFSRPRWRLLPVIRPGVYCCPTEPTGTDLEYEKWS